MAKIFFKLALLLLGLGSLTYGFYLANDNFTPWHVISDLPAPSQYHTAPLPPEEQAQIAAILGQPFTYLTKGCQTFVFLSSDRKHVLKLMKYQRYRNRTLLRWLAFLPFIKSYAHNMQQHRQNKLFHVFDSYLLAYNHFREATGLEYMHLTKGTAPATTLLLYDKLGLPHHFDASQLEFHLQRYCPAMLLPTLEQMIDNYQEQQAKALLNELVWLLLSEYRQGWVDDDFWVIKNVGVNEEGHPIKIDVGRYRYDPQYSRAAYYLPHLERKMTQAAAQLAHRPQLALHLKLLYHQISTLATIYNL